MIVNKFYIILLFLIFIGSANANDNYLDIDATYFEANEQDKVMIFKGDVKMTKNKDVLLCQTLLINTQIDKDDKNKQIPKDFNATGDVSFVLYLDDNIIKAKGQTVLFYPDEEKYIIIGDAYLEDTKDEKKLIANKIYIDTKTGYTRIDGDKDKPIKFRLKLNNKE